MISADGSAIERSQCHQTMNLSACTKPMSRDASESLNGGNFICRVAACVLDLLNFLRIQPNDPEFADDSVIKRSQCHQTRNLRPVYKTAVTKRFRKSQ